MSKQSAEGFFSSNAVEHGHQWPLRLRKLGAAAVLAGVVAASLGGMEENLDLLAVGTFAVEAGAGSIVAGLLGELPYTEQDNEAV